MGRDPSPLGSPEVEVKIHPRRVASTVHPGRGTSPPLSPPPHVTGESPLPPVNRTHQRERGRERERDRDFSLFKRWFPWLVPSFVVANITIFIVTMYVNDCPSHAFPSSSCVAPFLGRFSFQPLRENPLFGPSSITLGKMGALEVYKVVQKHQAWRLLSCIWLHGGVVHVLANMLSLVFIGIRLEQEFGFVRIGFLYVISGFGGSLLSALFIQSSISVGASGALFGLLGGMLSELLMNWTIYANKCAALLTLIVIVVINLAVGILPHVDNFAHIGGFVSGFLLGCVFLIRPQFKWVSQQNSPHGHAIQPVKYKHKPYQYVLWVISFILLLAGLITGLVLLLRGVNLNERCSWCHYLSCVPTSKWSCKTEQLYCETTQMGNQLNITCLSNGKSDIFPLLDTGSLKTQQLCSRVCNS